MTHPPTHDRAEALKDAYIVAVTGSDYRTSREENEFVLPVDFLDQFSWGRSEHNLNCGPASLVMAACYAKGEKPSGEKIGQVNKFLGIPPQGAFTNCPQLIKAAKSVFNLKVSQASWNINQIKEEIKKGNPVIAAVTSGYLSNRGYGWTDGHFVVVVGFSDNYLICHDPGTWRGDKKKYDVEEFKKALGAQKNAVIYGFGKINSPQPQPQTPQSQPQTKPKPPNPPEVDYPPTGIPPARRDKILLEKEPQHLGDDVQNVKMVYLKEFELSKEDLANRKEAVVKLRVKGIPKKDPIISFNRREVGRAVTKAGVWEWFEFSFKPDILHEGKNLLDIETFIPDFYETFDDCEFRDVYLILK
uniref:Peptidase C39-like domain-containing protein n=1 Tax=candidate division CPR3 bacterium TaxID=2268181 RepID=A0A7V3N4C3_UNCC3